MTKHTPSTALVPVKIGRPTKYRPELNRIVTILARLGAVDVDIAEALDVDVSQVEKWKGRHPAFQGALAAGKHPVNEQVKQSLLNRALGYDFKREHVVKIGKGAGSVVTTNEHIPGDVGACVIWLQNRDPENWKNVQHREHRHMVMHILPEDQDA